MMQRQSGAELGTAVSLFVALVAADQTAATA
jgi:hypothetical protein